MKKYKKAFKQLNRQQTFPKKSGATKYNDFWAFEVFGELLRL